MALLRGRMAYPQIRQPHNKESDWSGICDSVFDQYVNDDDVFGLSSQQRQSTSSDNSANLFDFSMSSGQSNHTTGTSPDPAWAEQVAMTAAAVESMPHVPLYAEQPQPKESLNFWQKTLKALERNAVETDEKQRKLRTSKSHPDFLSLGGNPSPACVPCPVPDHSFSVPRSRPRETANGKKRSTSQLRSVSRGRPQGIAKNNTTNTNTPNATMRKRSVSPTKMMTPSRYRAGFHDAWTDKIQGSPSKFALRVPTHALPDSPPSSAHLPQQQDFAVFGSPTNPSSTMLNAYDSELSPLTTTFQQARIHTPDASPFFAPVTHSYIEHHAYPTYAQHAVSYSATTQNPLAVERIPSFDFGFSAPTQESWNATAYEHGPMPDYRTMHVPTQDVFAGVEQNMSQNAYAAGLGISCDNTVFYPTTNADVYSIPAASYHAVQPVQAAHRTACYAPVTDMPLTPHKQRVQSRSPSPPMTEPRSRRPSGVSGLRRASKHRRAKSTTAIPRVSDKGGFVNFTPDDSNKILSGVAPSGSSKTKARREKEAADKRRRLSQAAVKAVVEAGGDLQSLAKAGLVL